MFTTGACSKNERGIHLQCDRSADEQGSGGKAAPVATLKYLYRKDGMIAGRVVDGKYQMYKYDKRGQLLQVADMQGNVAEKYVYDPAGNILSKTIAGKTTSYTYDKANQLVSSVCDGKTTHYEYDAAGRLIKEGDKSYSYGWLDKVLAVRENDKKIASFNYQVDGQIAQAIHGDQSEEFFWDGLALIHRGETSFINEPYVTGGNPILSSKQGVMFTDMLGSKSISEHIVEYDSIFAAQNRVAAGNIRFINVSGFSAMNQGEVIPQEIFDLVAMDRLGDLTIHLIVERGDFFIVLPDCKNFVQPTVRI